VLRIVAAALPPPLLRLLSSKQYSFPERCAILRAGCYRLIPAATHAAPCTDRRRWTWLSERRQFAGCCSWRCAPPQNLVVLFQEEAKGFEAEEVVAAEVLVMPRSPCIDRDRSLAAVVVERSRGLNSPSYLRGETAPPHSRTQSKRRLRSSTS